jgi:hypothetical protein
MGAIPSMKSTPAILPACFGLAPLNAAENTENTGLEENEGRRFGADDTLR